jgi:putative ABC transport system permease protein
MADDAVFIPMTTIKERWGDRNVKRSSGSTDIELVEVHEAILEVTDPDQVIPTAEAVKSVMARFHRKEDYTVVVPLALIEEAKRTKRIFNIVLGSIAGISLVVGGIGIMNIMLATVTERTREIGIRRALGARRRDITLQFLAESLTLCLVGGLVGVGLGLLVPVYVEWKFDLPTLVHTDSVVLAFGISAATGLLFGIYPAARAARLDPIEALRHE